MALNQMGVNRVQTCPIQHLMGQISGSELMQQFWEGSPRASSRPEQLQNSWMAQADHQQGS